MVDRFVQEMEDPDPETVWDLDANVAILGGEPVRIIRWVSSLWVLQKEDYFFSNKPFFTISYDSYHNCRVLTTRDRSQP